MVQCEPVTSHQQAYPQPRTHTPHPVLWGVPIKASNIRNKTHHAMPNPRETNPTGKTHRQCAFRIAQRHLQDASRGWPEKHTAAKPQPGLEQCRQLDPSPRPGFEQAAHLAINRDPRFGARAKPCSNPPAGFRTSRTPCYKPGPEVRSTGRSLLQSPGRVSSRPHTLL